MHGETVKSQHIVEIELRSSVDVWDGYKQSGRRADNDGK
jgi:hypothetical protein